MHNLMKKRIFPLVLLVLTIMSFVADSNKTVIYMIGDSTMAIKAKDAFPEMGWGVPFAQFFDSTIAVDNRAQNGRSTRTFVAEGRWKKVMETLTKGDYVFIQFGHNDEVPTKGSYTKPGDYVAFLKGFISDARSRQATPVLFTPVARRSFDISATTIVDTHAEYSQLVKNVAEETNVPLIDLNTKSRELYERLGAEGSKLLFLQLQPGENPNYPKGKEDNTHFNELGARMIAQIVLQEMRALHLPVNDHIFKGKR